MAGERGSASARDGHAIAVTRFAAAGPAKGTVVFSGAMGVRQDFYAPLAAHFAQNGYVALTFDYRGMGWSRSGGLRGFDTDVVRWAQQDLGGMLEEGERLAPGAPLFVLGHSLGGQILGIAPGNERVAGMISVTAGSGWYKYNDRMPVGVRIFWFAAIPLLTPLFGYFPGKALRMVGDLPQGVARQWRNWCVHPDYLLGENPAWRGDFERVRCDIVGYSFEDDPIITKPAIDNLHGFYARANVERRHLAPRDAGAKRIGHFGYFSPASRETLWKDALAWLGARSPAMACATVRASFTSAASIP